MDLLVPPTADLSHAADHARGVDSLGPIERPLLFSTRHRSQIAQASIDEQIRPRPSAIVRGATNHLGYTVDQGNPIAFD